MTLLNNTYENSTPKIYQDSTSLFEFVRDNKQELENSIQNHGAVLLRGYKISSLSEFQKISEVICDQLFDYTYRSSPRTKLGGKVYTSTEYPSDREIPMHHENSYSREWPKKILFHCAIEPEVGGETPIADGSQVYSLIPSEIRNEFESKKIMYVRNYGIGMDLPWQEVFQTDSKDQVEEFCAAHSIEWKWLGDDRLRTQQVAQASIVHPQSGLQVWFNQAHLFHESANPPELREFFKSYSRDELPRHSFFGDGTEIPESIFTEIWQAFRKAEIVFPWQKGDVLVLDNLRFAHARKPFQGKRKIVVSMGN